MYEKKTHTQAWSLLSKLLQIQIKEEGLGWNDQTL